MGTNQVRNADGHLEPIDDEALTDIFTLNELAGVVLGDVLVMEAAGTVKKYDASVAADCDSICGLAGGVVADGQPVTVYKDGAVLDGFVGQTPGEEQICDPTTGALGAYADLAVGEFAKWMGRFDSATEFKISIGERFTR